LFGAFAWVVTLRRRVRVQTAALRERLEREGELERDYRDRLEAMVWERTQDLERAQEELIRKERLATLGQLTATVSHELRNPLGTIRGSVFFVADSLRDAPPAVRRALDRAERNIVRCDAIIEELLEYARVRDLVRQPTDLDAWLREALAELRLPPGIALVRDLASGAGVSIDRQRVLRCIINVVTNATEAIGPTGPGSPPRGSRIEVSSRATAERVEIRIADDGPGIPPDLRQRIFEPFFSTKSFGVGLGLPIVQQIMEQHGGGVVVESAPGRTVFSLWVRAEVEERDREAV
jgi:signal transduction histidine kinase